MISLIEDCPEHSATVPRNCTRFLTRLLAAVSFLKNLASLGFLMNSSDMARARLAALVLTLVSQV